MLGRLQQFACSAFPAPLFARRQREGCIGTAIRERLKRAPVRQLERTRVRRYMRLVTLALACLVTSQPGHAKALLKVSFVEVVDRITPTSDQTSTRVNMEVEITQGGSIEQAQTRTSGEVIKSGSTGMRLGKGARSSAGTWRVAGPNQLINVRKYPTFERAIQVIVEGSTCQARVGYNLNSGQTEYHYTRLSTGERAIARTFSGQNTTCAIH